tara:strand:- start:3189 stop:3488 length:300 start_codon:yes stop_codon:yes gene_type:complete
MFKNLKALNNSTILTVLFITFMTIVGEINKPFKEFLASITGHHWLTKSVLSVVFFVIAYALLSKTKKELNTEKDISHTIIITILSFLAILFFFIWHYIA